MRQVIRHGASIDVATPVDVQNAVRAAMGGRKGQTSLIRATAIVVLDGNGNGQDEVYTCPIGMEFAARRLFVNISTASDPNTGNVPLNVAGKFVAIKRSNTFVEYAILVAPSGISQVPGLQTWSSEEGPYLRNGETFEIQAFGLTPAAILTVNLQGLQHEPGEYSDR